MISGMGLLTRFAGMVILVVLATAAPDAQGYVRPSDADPQVAGWLQTARTFWHVPADQPYPAVDVGPLPDPAAWAMADSGGIVLNQDIYPWPPALEPRWLWNHWMCVLIVHEYGHVLGFGHSTDPYNIMYPVLWFEAVPQCMEPAVTHLRRVGRRRAARSRIATRIASYHHVRRSRLGRLGHR
jgi:hypothetical protein